MEILIVIVIIAVVARVLFAIVERIAMARNRAYDRRMAAKAAKAFVSPLTGLDALQATLQERARAEQKEAKAKEDAEKAREQDKLDEIQYRSEMESAWAAHRELISSAIARVQTVLDANDAGTLDHMTKASWHHPPGSDPDLDEFSAWYGVDLDGAGSGSIRLYCERGVLIIQRMDWNGKEDGDPKEFLLSELTEQKLADALADALIPSL